MNELHPKLLEVKPPHDLKLGHRLAIIFLVLLLAACTTVKTEYQLPNQALDAPRAAGTYRVVFYNDTSVALFPTSKPDDSLYLPASIIHRIYNTDNGTLDFLAVLSPTKSEGLITVEVSGQKPRKPVHA